MTRLRARVTGYDRPITNYRYQVPFKVTKRNVTKACTPTTFTPQNTEKKHVAKHPKY